MKISNTLLSDIYNLMLLVAIFAFINKNSNKGRVEWFKNLIVLLFTLVITKLVSELPVNDSLFGWIPLVGTFILYLITPLIGCFIMKYVYDCMGTASCSCRIKKKNATLLFIYLGIFMVNLLMLVVSNTFNMGLFYYFDGTKYNKGILYDARTFVIALEYLSIQLYIIFVSMKNKHEFSRALWLFPLYTIVITGLQFRAENLTHDYSDILFYSVLLYIYMQSRELNTDFLTGAVNRRKFDAELDKRVCNGNEIKFSGIMLDIDRFKLINDNYGHQAGDEALEAFSAIVIRNFRKTDIVARYGGDEFCILTDICDKDEIEQAMERLRKGVEDFNATKKFPFDISLSLGYAIYDYETDGSSAAFLKRLDEKMYQEKEIHHREAKLNDKKNKDSINVKSLKDSNCVGNVVLMGEDLLTGE